MRAKPRRSKQAGKVIVRQVGDHRCIQYSDGGAKPLKEWSRQYQTRMRDGFGSHMNGKHKMG